MGTIQANPLSLAAKNLGNTKDQLKHRLQIKLGSHAERLINEWDKAIDADRAKLRVIDILKPIKNFPD